VRIVRHVSLALATLTTGLVAGFFYAYACSVTLGLARLGNREYVATMQAINESVRNPVFAAGFFGALVCLVVTAAAHLPIVSTPGARLVLLALAAYGLGGFGLTVGVNVPLNEQLAGVSLAATPEALSAARQAYEGPWNFWNAVRTVFSTSAFLILIGALFGRADATPESRRLPESASRPAEG
jgi:uncharacterized membrane protein